MTYNQLVNDRRAEGLRRAVDEAVNRYVARNPTSEERHLRAKSVLPGGNTRSVLYYKPFPLTFKKAEEARLYSVDDQVYRDFLGEFTAGLYGHSNRTILDAVKAAMESGVSYGGHNEHEAILAAELCKRFPSFDLVRFTNSGTEANLMAIATARHYTARDRIVVFEGAYHGGLLTFTTPSALNVPYDVCVLQYNDEDGLERFFAESGEQVAAVLVEPVQGAGGCIPAEREFLCSLREQCRKSGALLVFDEVMTSRLSEGGVQAIEGINPDLTTVGKYLGGGMSFGAFGGRRDIMSMFDPESDTRALQHAGTFNNNIFSMVAGTVGLQQVYTADVAKRLNERGDDLRTELNQIFDRSGLAFQVTGRGSMLCFHSTRSPIKRWADLKEASKDAETLLFHHLIERGIWTASRGMIALSLPLSEEDFSHLVSAVSEFAEEYRDLVSI